MKPGYFYLHNNTPVIATEEKPDETSFYYQANGTHLVHAEYYDAMEEWEQQLIPLKNVTKGNENTPPGEIFISIGKQYYLVSVYVGSEVEHTDGEITKIK